LHGAALVIAPGRFSVVAPKHCSEYSRSRPLASATGSSKREWPTALVMKEADSGCHSTFRSVLSMKNWGLVGSMLQW
jgi:hypothetical protein